MKIYIVRHGKKRLERINLSTLLKRLNKHSFNSKAFTDKTTAEKYRDKTNKQFNKNKNTKS